MAFTNGLSNNEEADGKQHDAMVASLSSSATVVSSLEVVAGVNELLFGSLAGISGGPFDAKGWSPAQFRNKACWVIFIIIIVVV